MADSDEGIYDIAPDENHPAEPPRKSGYPLDKQVPLPCPKCGYELRGTRMQNCPECGKAVSYSSLMREVNRDKINLWKDVYRLPVIWIIVGLTVGLSVWGYNFGLLGMGVFLVVCLFLVISGWIIFTICSFVWIGFDQPMHTTAVQLAGAYIGATGLSALFDFIPVKVVAWLLTIVVLVSLLQHLLDIETNDAILVAFFVWVARVFLFMAIAAMML